jgi:phosphate transport system permease protein
MATDARTDASTGAGGLGPSRGQARQAHAKLPHYASWAVLGTALVLALLLALVTGSSVVLLVCAAVVVYAVVIYVWARRVEGKRHATDRIVSILVVSCFTVAMIPLVSLIWTVIENGLNRFDWTFFTSDMRNVTGEGGGGLHAIMGTIIITSLATVFAVPIGILAAIYLHEYGTGWLVRPLTFFVDVMTGIPSIVAGLFAVSLFTIILGPGTKLGVMGSVALTVLMIPIVVRSTEEMLKVVPDGLREAAYALGVPKWRTILKVVLPTALTGIVTGVILAISRIIGETAPLLLTTGVIATTNLNPFQGRMNNLPVFSYYSYTAPGVPPEPYIDRAWTAALVLVLMVLVLFVGARIVSSRFGVVAKGR